MDSFFARPILDSPHAYPVRHWELDEDGQPTNRIIEARRRSELITPVPKPQKRRRDPNQAGFVFDSGEGLSSEEQEYNSTGATRFVNFTTSKPTRWKTDPRRCHVNWVVCDSDWEAEFCRVIADHPRVKAYVKNQSLGFEVPYLLGATPKRYLPDFIVQIDDGREDPLNLVVEIKGYRGEDAKEKATTMDAYWLPGVNNLGRYGRCLRRVHRHPRDLGGFRSTGRTFRRRQGGLR